jgi:hypothetical protein
MGRVIAIDAAGALAFLVLWYVAFAHYNRRRGLGIIRWVQTACEGRGKVTGVCWRGSSRLLAELRFPPHMFERAHVVVRLLPRTIPVNWALSRWRREKETLAFEADLDTAPRFSLEVHNHRWSGHNSNTVSSTVSSREWIVTRPGPIVLTSRSQWGQELSPVINSLMASREKHFVTIRFSPQSPHFSAILEIDSIAKEPGDHGWLEALRELASGASTSRQ